MAHIASTWTADRSSRLAAQAVLSQFLPAHRTPAQIGTFIVGGLAALACHDAPAAHGHLVVNALHTASLPTNETPIVLFKSASLRGREAAAQAQYARSANDHSLGAFDGTLQEPFSTNLFFARDPEGRNAVRGHLKVLPLVVRPHLLRDIDFDGHIVRHAAWDGVVAGELLLGADADCPAPLMVIRWALLLGIDEVRASNPDVHGADRDELVHSHVAAAARDLIPDAHRGHVVTRWLAKLNDDYYRSAVAYEWRLSSENESRRAGEPAHVAFHALEERFREVVQSLRAILIVRPPGAHSLSKSSFAPTARRRNERSAVFA
ncbi:hypothetical protein JCM8208_003112 [Rhodotorula glutinis]